MEIINIILDTKVKWFKDSACETDVTNLDHLINARAAEGWELVTHSYTVNVLGINSAILVTFKKQK